MEEKVVLDKETFKALSVESRLTILKLLKLRHHTLTELAAELELSQSTVKEHLAKLEEAALIKQLDEGRKWKYYKLTRKGKNVVDPREVKVMFLFGLSLAGAVGAGLYILRKLFSSTANASTQSASAMMARSAPQPEAFIATADVAVNEESSNALARQGVEEITYTNTTTLSQLPTQDLLMWIVLGIAILGIIFSLIYFYKQKQKIKKQVEAKQ